MSGQQLTSVQVSGQVAEVAEVVAKVRGRGACQNSSSSCNCEPWDDHAGFDEDSRQHCRLGHCPSGAAAVPDADAALVQRLATMNVLHGLHNGAFVCFIVVAIDTS